VYITSLFTFVSYEGLHRDVIGLCTYGVLLFFCFHFQIEILDDEPKTKRKTNKGKLQKKKTSKRHGKHETDDEEGQQSMESEADDIDRKLSIYTDHSAALVAP